MPQAGDNCDDLASIRAGGFCVRVADLASVRAGGTVPSPERANRLVQLEKLLKLCDATVSVHALPICVETAQLVPVEAAQ